MFIFVKIDDDKSIINYESTIVPRIGEKVWVFKSQDTYVVRDVIHSIGLDFTSNTVFLYVDKL